MAGIAFVQSNVGWKVTLPHRHMIVLLLIAALTACEPVIARLPNGEVRREYDLGLHRIPLVYPAGASPVLSDYGSSTNMVGQLRTFIHNGIDLGNVGDPVLAMADGYVYFAAHRVSGNSINIQHGRDEDGLIMVTTYGHLHEIRVVKGQFVRRGDVIGIVGNTGQQGYAGPVGHVHINVLLYSDERDWPISRNPHRYWLDGPGRITCFDPRRSYPPSPYDEERKKTPPPAYNFYRSGKTKRPMLFTYPIPCK